MNSTICERLHQGQAVSITGKYLAGEGFLAVEISPGDTEAEIMCPIHTFDAQRGLLRVFDQTFALSPQVEIKSLDGDPAEQGVLQAGRMIKLKGKYEPEQGFLPEKIKLRETREFNIEEMQGVISRIEPEARRIYVNGIPILIDERTILEESNGNFEF